MVNLNPNQPDQGSFLPDDYVRGKGEQKSNVVILLLFGAILVGTVGVFVLNVQRQRSLAQEVKAVRAEFEAESGELEQLRALEDQRIELLDRADVVNAISEKIPRSILLAELWRDMPQDLLLDSVSLQGKRIATAPPKRGAPKRGTLTPGSTAGTPQPVQPKVLPPKFEHFLELVGFSYENTDISDYVASLRQSPLFSSVDVSNIEGVDQDGTDLRKYTITMKLREMLDITTVEGVTETELRSTLTNVQTANVETDQD